MRKNPRRILSPQRLPFRHPGAGTTNLTNVYLYCNPWGSRVRRRRLAKYARSFDTGSAGAWPARGQRHTTGWAIFSLVLSISELPQLRVH